MSKFTVILFIVFLYLFLFNPPLSIFVGNFHFGNVFTLLAFAFYLLKPTLTQRYTHVYKKEFALILYLMTYSLFRNILSGGTSIFTQHLISIINVFMVVPFIINYVYKNEKDCNNYIIRSLLIVGAIGSIITTLCFLIPSFNIFTKEVLMKYSHLELNNEMNDYRSYGFASLLSSDYGYILGILLVIGCFYHKNNKWFFYFMPFVFLSVLINARTGILIAMSGFFLFFLSNRNFKFSLLLLFCIVFFNYSDELTKTMGLNEKTIDWISYAYESTNNAIRSGDINESATLTAIFSDFWVLPDDLEQWLFGRGFDLYRNTQGVHVSDVGWIRELNFGGLFYLIPFVYLFLVMFKRFYLRYNKAFAWFFLVTFIIINTKTIIFPGGKSFYVFVIIYYITTSSSLLISYKNAFYNKR